ncbi:hypothetical protein [Adhaeribacter aquaticus]|uniref:hypothetical protein n=1 Tax=Adhaeribacter aquaticus TaxID=299567 RepID=UPI00047C869C|nr:hypothetical protein [Adhaeribacter aquaticus]
MGLKDIVNTVKKEVEVLQKEDAKDKLFTEGTQYTTQEAASEAFEKAKQKLFAVNKWSGLPGISSTFELHDANGNQLFADRPEIGQFVRIKLPGIPLENWVQVVNIKEEKQAAEFTVKPSPDPTEEHPQEVKHFFGKEASSTFRVELQGTTLKAYEIGQEEKPNNQGEEAGNRAIVNTLVAEGGWAGFQKLQWDKLTAYLVHKIEVE